MTAMEGPIADSLTLPSEPYRADATPQAVSGITTRRAFRLPGRSDRPVQITAPLERALRDAGFEIVFACSDADCGGFDFRFQLSLLPAPAMYVDLGDYRYVLARQASDEGSRLISLVASRAGDGGTLHITEVAPLGSQPPLPKAQAFSEEPPLSAESEALPATPLIERLERDGHVALTEIDFPSGAAELPEGAYPSIDEIAEWLKATPSARVAVVGHTDAVGSLAANTELSRRRAAFVARALTDRTPGAQGRVEASGVGYLAPVASNLTPEGRAANRRVEVVLLAR